MVWTVILSEHPTKEKKEKKVNLTYDSRKEDNDA